MKKKRKLERVYKNERVCKRTLWKKTEKNLKNMHKVMLTIFLRFKKKRGDYSWICKKKKSKTWERKTKGMEEITII